jgi:hypothetical protein
MKPGKPIPKWLLKAIVATVPGCPFTVAQLQTVLLGAPTQAYCPDCGQAVDLTQGHVCAVKNFVLIGGGPPVRYPIFQRAAAAPPTPAADALTGLLAGAVRAQEGRCLTCNATPALYCGHDCAVRGR